MSNSSLSAYTSYLNKVSAHLNGYSSLAMISIGVPGNLISLIIFSRLIQKKTNMGLLYTIQCIVDLISILFINVVSRMLAFNFGIQISTLNDSLCKLSIFMRRATLHFSVWMAVITTFDRFLFVLYEHRFKFIRKKSILSSIILAVFIAIALIDIPNLMYYLNTSTRTCTASNEIILSSDVISIVMRTYLPITIMLVFNIIMIRAVTKRTQTSSSSSASLNKNGRIRERNFTLAVISYDLIVFITHFPISIAYIVYDVQLYSGSFQSNPFLAAVYNLAFNVFAFFSLLDQVLSFFTYIAFNKLFRQEFLKLISKCLPLAQRFQNSDLDQSNTR